MFEISLLLIEPRTSRSSLVDVSISATPKTIGRKDTPIVVEDEKCSRRHAELFVRNGRVVIRDLRSSNGTFVDGRKVELEALKVGSRIKIGGTNLQVTRMESVEVSGQSRPDGQNWSDGFRIID